jgi:uncharacterized protein YuzE
MNVVFDTEDEEPNMTVELGDIVIKRSETDESVTVYIDSETCFEITRNGRITEWNEKHSKILNVLRFSG